MSAVLWYALAGFMVPPVLWLLSGLYLAVWNVQEMLRIILSPFIWVYVAAVVGPVVALIGRTLNRALAGTVETPQRSVNRIPWIFLVSMTFYCIVGPNVALLGQTLSTPFLDQTEYLLAQFLGIPLILLFTTPFYMLMNGEIERATVTISLDPHHRFLSLRGKMTIGFVLNLIGSVVTMVTAAISLRYAGDQGIAVSFTGRLVVVAVIVTTTATANLILMVRQILSPVRGFSFAMEGLFSAFTAKRGRLVSSMRVVTRDELGYLAASFDRFLTALRSLITEVQNAARRTRESGAELVASNRHTIQELESLDALTASVAGEFDDLARELGKTSAATTDAAGAIAGMSSELDALVSRLEHAAATMAQVEGQSGSSQRVVEGARESFAELRELAAQGVRAGEASRTSSREVISSANVIGTALGVIEDIAARTHLLAMNAAIEAAHAGERGRGFAVVAQEIRGLSENTRRQATQITDSLGALQQHIDESYGAVEKTAIYFGRVEEVTAAVTEQFDQVATNTREAAAASGEAQEIIVGVASGSRTLQATGSDVSERVSKVAGTLTTVERLGDRTRDAFNRIQGSMEELRRRLSDVNQFVDAANASSTELVSHVDGFETE